MVGSTFLAEDWSYIDESHQDGGIVEERKRKYMEEVNIDRERAVFAKYKISDLIDIDLLEFSNALVYLL